MNLVFKQTYRQSASAIKLFFILRDGTKRQVQATPGQHLLEIAKKHDVQLQGACEASLACSTCHVILPSAIYEKLSAAKDEQEDLLDLAFGLTSTSRLGCQVKVNQFFQNIQITLPKASRNLYVDGTKPSQH